MPDLTPEDWLDTPVHIDTNGISFGDHRLPGVIADNGITVTHNVNGCNTLTVTFLVGNVTVEESH